MANFNIHLIQYNKNVDRRNFLDAMYTNILFYYILTPSCITSHHNHKKQKDSLETWAVLIIFFLELKISRLSVKKIHQKSEEWCFL